MNPSPESESFPEKWWSDALGVAPVRDFIRKVFAPSPAMVKRASGNEPRMWAKFDKATFSEAEYEIVPDMWDHEHCSVCMAKIKAGDHFWQNSEDHILCTECYVAFEKRG